MSLGCLWGSWPWQTHLASPFWLSGMWIFGEIRKKEEGWWQRLIRLCLEKPKRWISLFHHPSSIFVIRLAASALEHFRPSAGRIQMRCHFQSLRVSVSDSSEWLMDYSLSWSLGEGGFNVHGLKYGTFSFKGFIIFVWVALVQTWPLETANPTCFWSGSSEKSYSIHMNSYFSSNVTFGIIKHSFSPLQYVNMLVTRSAVLKPQPSAPKR